MIVLGGWTGRTVLGNGRFGYRPDEFASLGADDPPLLDDVDPGDEDTEFVWVIRALPSSGTLVANDDGGMSHTGAADGTYVTAYGLYTWAPGGPGVYEGDTDFTTAFGINIRAEEVDTALALAAVAVSATGLAAETDAALALAGSQLRAVGISSETDIALALDAGAAGAVGRADETDQALALAAVQIAAVGLASETDAAVALAGVSIRAVGLCAEADGALPLAALHIIVTGLAAEVDAALGLIAGGPMATGLATETDTALALAPGASAELSAFWRYDVPADGMGYSVPASSLRFDVPSIGAGLTLS